MENLWKTLNNLDKDKHLLFKRLFNNSYHSSPFFFFLALPEITIRGSPGSEWRPMCHGYQEILINSTSFGFLLFLLWSFSLRLISPSLEGQTYHSYLSMLGFSLAGYPKIVCIMTLEKKFSIFCSFAPWRLLSKIHTVVLFSLQVDKNKTKFLGIFR